MQRRGETLKTLAISKSALSVARIPSNTLVYMTGNTIKKEINMDNLRDGNQIRVNMIKEATGTDLIVKIKGADNSMIRGKQKDKAARRIPRITASRKPQPILIREKPMEFQKSAVRANCPKRRRTWKGDTKRISWSRAMLPICHRPSQKHTAQRRILPE